MSYLYQNWDMVVIPLLTDDEIRADYAIDAEYIERQAEHYCKKLEDIPFVMEIDHITLKFFFRNDYDAIQFKLALR